MAGAAADHFSRRIKLASFSDQLFAAVIIDDGQAFVAGEDFKQFELLIGLSGKPERPVAAQRFDAVHSSFTDSRLRIGGNESHLIGVMQKNTLEIMSVPGIDPLHCEGFCMV
jgi:hypothetical protein